MTELLSLFISFMIIGFSAFGGGSSTITLIRYDIVNRHAWLSLPQFVNVVALAEMTPVPLAVNAATFTGYVIEGLPGAICATVAVVLPSLLLMGIVTAFLSKFYENPHVIRFRCALEAGVLALIILAIWSLGQAAVTNLVTLFMAVGAFALLMVLREKLHPLWLIIVFGLVGVFLL